MSPISIESESYDKLTVLPTKKTVGVANGINGANGLNGTTGVDGHHTQTDLAQAATQGSLVAAAEKILALAKQLEGSIDKSPSYQDDTLANLPIELEKTRNALIDETGALNWLVRGAAGPFGRISTVSGTYYSDEMSLQFVYRFKIPHLIPLDGTMTFASIGAAINVDETTVKRLLRNAMTFGMFHEPSKNTVAHTYDSRLLASDASLFDYVGCSLEDLRPAALRQMDALQKWPQSGEPNECGFNVAWDTDLPLYRYLMQFPERIRRASGLMVQVSRAGARNAKKLASMYPWQALGKGVVVDMGGGNGHVSVALAEQHKDLNFIVEDLPGVSVQGEKDLPAHLKERVRFQPHDFFTENPVKDAAAFFMMNTIHTWSDKYVVDIFKRLTSALQPGARVLICERVMPEPEDVTAGRVSETEYKEVLSIDLFMMHNVNGRERSIEDIFGLFRQADPRFKFFNAYRAEDSLFTICEAFWAP